MARWAPERRDVLEALATEILHNYRRGRAIVAVDGRRPEDTGPFADDLAIALREAGHDAFRASIEDFQLPRAEREKATTPADVLEGTFDESVLRRVLVEPFRMAGGAGFVTAAYDAHRDQPRQAKWLSGPADAALVIDGRWLQRPAVRGMWNVTIWLAVDHAEPDEAQRLYEKDVEPGRTSPITIDATDPEHPRRVFADSC